MTHAETYRRFSDAWAERDLDTLMSLVTDDIVYGASVGPEPGETFAGREAVRAGFARMLALDAAVTLEVERFDLIGDRAYSAWTYRLPDGSSVRGMDAIEFRGGKIAIKQGYRKTRG